MKPVLIGMNNPLHSAPRYALFPHPPGCAGHRLYMMLRSRQPGVLRQSYLEAFDRRNLIYGQTWPGKSEAYHAAIQMLSTLRGRTVVVLGNAVRDAFALPPLLVHPQELYGVTWRQLPHPSGRNLWYNDPKHREVASLLMEELYLDYVQSKKEAVA